MEFLIVDDDFGARGGMGQALRTLYPQAAVHEAASLAEAIAALAARPATALVLLDLNLDDSRGMDTLRRLKGWCEEQDINPRLVVVSAAADYDESVVVDAIDHCATGFVAKGTSLEIFRSAIDLTLAGSIFIPERYLLAKRATWPAAAEAAPPMFTRREREVAALLVQGLTYKQIARRLEQADPAHAISDHTVRVHVQRMAWKLRVADDAAGVGLSAKAAVVTAFAERKLRFDPAPGRV